MPSHRHRRSREPEPSESFQQFFSLGGHSSTDSEIPGAGAEPEPPAALLAAAIEGSSSRKVLTDFISVSFIVFIFLFCYFGNVL